MTEVSKGENDERHHELFHSFDFPSNKGGLQQQEYKGQR
jgi:hypothetical protein